ncbi:MAG: hypothetical protein IKN04_23090 [Clostridia bacterium]|nr:hypothetical protein [Clostridia bacterium]
MKRQALCLMAAAVLLAGLMIPAAAESVLDVYATGNFGKKVNYAVYTGPGFEYVRANSGKASYGGGSCRIYGVTGDWIMIGYGLSSGDYRIGYIYRSALDTLSNVNGTVNYSLTFQPYTAYADDYCRVTDDPVMNNKMMYTVPEGTEVTVLATMGSSWTYVEVQTLSGPMRGFVWSKHLYGGNAPAPVYTPEPTPPQNACVSVAPVYNNVYVTAVPQVTATPQPYIVNTFYETAAPAFGAVTPNTYYHASIQSEWLPAAQEINLDGSWPVYSGPGTYYYRANNSRATFGGGLCRMYGVDGDWLMIGYALSNGNYRIGYISLDALPQAGLRVPYLDLQSGTRRLASAVHLTDDPVFYRPTVAVLPAGTHVLFLGSIWENNETWAYVEVLADGAVMRGFVPASSME